MSARYPASFKRSHKHIECKTCTARKLLRLVTRKWVESHALCWLSDVVRK